MSITARVIADSVSPAGKRLTTMQLRYPKWIHGEAKTHRVLSISDCVVDLYQEVGVLDDKGLSRSSSSSRAVPFERMVRDVLDDPATPVWWGKNQPGMQAREELDGLELIRGQSAWLKARDLAVDAARALAMCGLHKQVVNRVVEPFAHINTLVTATEYDNFFALRCHPDAQPEIRVLAGAMRDAMAASMPAALAPGQWHLPYVTEDDCAAVLRHNGALAEDEAQGHRWWKARTFSSAALDRMKAVSVARCARVSYLTHDGRPTTVGEDLALYGRLVGQVPMHASPMEHVATPDDAHLDERSPSAPGRRWDADGWRHPQEHGNLVGWRQLRRQLEPGT